MMTCKLRYRLKGEKEHTESFRCRGDAQEYLLKMAKAMVVIKSEITEEGR